MSTKWTVTSHDIVGMYFLGFEYREDGIRRMTYQGQIVKKLDSGFYLAVVHEWLTGSYGCHRLFSLYQMGEFEFYETADEVSQRAENKGGHE